MRLKDNIYAITGLMHSIGVNAGFIVTKKSVVVIDSSWYGVSARFIINYIKEITENPIKYLILTEWHSDHIFGMKYFKDAGAKIVSHKNTKEFLKENKNYPEKLIKILVGRKKFDYKSAKILFGKIKLCDIDKTISKDTTLNIDGEKIILMTTPGHTDSNICVYIPRSKILFASDTIYSEFTPTTRFGNVRLWKGWIKSLEKIEKLDIDILVPGHGRILKGKQIKKEIERHKKYLLNKIKEKPFK
jgi:glyoxylase-like metal-dependent hydrolase (beta-lactamase superfamily II)